MKKKILKNKEKNLVHIKIEEPDFIRKMILTSAIDTASLPKYQEEYGRLKEREIGKLNQLNYTLKSIKTLFNRLKKEVPSLQEIEEKEIKDVEIKSKGRKKVKVEKSLKPEITDLDREIADIRRKLQYL